MHPDSSSLIEQDLKSGVSGDHLRTAVSMVKHIGCL